MHTRSRPVRLISHHSASLKPLPTCTSLRAKGAAKPNFGAGVCQQRMCSGYPLGSPRASWGKSPFPWMGSPDACREGGQSCTGARGHAVPSVSPRPPNTEPPIPQQYQEISAHVCGSVQLRLLGRGDLPGAERRCFATRASVMTLKLVCKMVLFI